MTENHLPFPLVGFYPFDDAPATESTIISKCVSDSPLNAATFLRMNKDALSILHLNCRSLLAHQSKVDLLLQSLNYLPDICVLTETWLYDDALMLPFNNYVQFNKNRSNNRKGGGVSLLHHSSIMSSEYGTRVTPLTFEFIVRQLLLDNIKLVCIGVYRPPNTDAIVFLNELDELLSSISSSCDNNTIIMLAGDFNINILDDCNCSRNFVNVLTTYSLYPTIFLPTLPTSNSLIDNIFFSRPGLLASYVLTADVSDHMPILSCFDVALLGLG
jgi:endonuclease/exonuclease/phosphatase (EEP) superfamily protein YafD